MEPLFDVQRRVSQFATESCGGEARRACSGVIESYSNVLVSSPKLHSQCCDSYEFDLGVEIKIVREVFYYRLRPYHKLGGGGCILSKPNGAKFYNEWLHKYQGSVVVCPCEEQFRERRC